MRTITFVAFTYFLLLGITAYVAFVIRPLPEAPPAPQSPEAKMETALNALDTALLGQLTSENVAISLPDGATARGEDAAIAAMGTFLQQQAPAKFQWWEFEPGLSMGKLYTKGGTYHLEFEQQSGQFVRIKCKRA